MDRRVSESQRCGEKLTLLLELLLHCFQSLTSANEVTNPGIPIALPCADTGWRRLPIGTILPMLTALIFGTDRETTAQLQQLCSLTQDVCVYRSLERYPQAHETMRLLNSFSPQLVFLGADDEAAAHAVERDIRSIQPDTAIFGVSSRMKVMQAFETSFGGFPVYPIPCSPGDFRAAIVHSLEARCATRNAAVFAFLPAKAGSGATTTALFVANILASLAQKKVLMLECDLHAGPISMLYNLRPSYSIMDALEDSHRLTDENWSEMVTRTGGIDVLSSVSRLGVRKVSPWGYQRLLSFVRNRYDIVIGDLPEVVNDATEVVARAAQAVFVVTTPSNPSLYLATRRRYDLEARGVAATKVKYIINRKSSGRDIPREAGWAIDAEKVAAIPVDASLVDTSELQPDLVNFATLAEYTKIAEFCCGTTLVPKRTGFRWFGLEGWLRGGARSPELYSSAAR
jgi:MinD-like ATPase involved in chromosome partitioning or flagellar assembly